MPEQEEATSSAAVTKMLQKGLSYIQQMGISTALELLYQVTVELECSWRGDGGMQ